MTPPDEDAGHEAADDELFEEEDDDDHTEGMFTTAEALLGELGLVPKHTFLYYFDFGDSHEFRVKVVGIERRANGGDAPRLVAVHGVAPRQYDWYGDEDEL